MQQGTLLLEEGQYDEAMRFFRKAVEVDPTNRIAARQLENTQGYLKKKTKNREYWGREYSMVLEESSDPYHKKITFVPVEEAFETSEGFVRSSAEISDSEGNFVLMVSETEIPGVKELLLLRVSNTISSSKILLLHLFLLNPRHQKPIRFR